LHFDGVHDGEEGADWDRGEDMMGFFNSEKALGRGEGGSLEQERDWLAVKNVENDFEVVLLVNSFTLLALALLLVETGAV
jgi:hypothetical protein